MLDVNAPDSLLQVKPVCKMTQEEVQMADQTLEYVRDLIAQQKTTTDPADKKTIPNQEDKVIKLLTPVQIENVVLKVMDDLTAAD